MQHVTTYEAAGVPAHTRADNGEFDRCRLSFDLSDRHPNCVYRRREFRCSDNTQRHPTDRFKQ